jgi:hypothetical protein
VANLKGQVDMTERIAGARLLPWTGPDGKPQYLKSDGDPTTSIMTNIADHAEVEQLTMAARILIYADELQNRPGEVTTDEFRWMSRRLAECLSDVTRIAESRGQRLEDGQTA